MGENLHSSVFFSPFAKILTWAAGFKCKWFNLRVLRIVKLCEAIASIVNAKRCKEFYVKNTTTVKAYKRKVSFSLFSNCSLSPFTNIEVHTFIVASNFGSKWITFHIHAQTPLCWWPIVTRKYAILSINDTCLTLPLSVLFHWHLIPATVIFAQVRWTWL